MPLVATEEAMLKEIALIMLVVIVASLIECFLILPGHLRHAFERVQRRPPSRARQRFEAAFARFPRATFPCPDPPRHGAPGDRGDRSTWGIHHRPARVDDGLDQDADGAQPRFRAVACGCAVRFGRADARETGVPGPSQGSSAGCRHRARPGATSSPTSSSPTTPPSTTSRSPVRSSPPCRWR